MQAIDAAGCWLLRRPKWQAWLAGYAMTAALLNADRRSMPYRNLGNTGLVVSALSFGCMGFNDTDPPGFSDTNYHTVPERVTCGERAFALVHAAYRGGVNFFDTAEGYGAGASERVLGQAIAMGVKRGIWERMDLVVSAKLFFGGRGGRDTVNSVGLSKKKLYEGLRASLRNLQLEYVDVVFAHRPDPRTPVEEIVRGMNALIEREGCTAVEFRT